MARVEVSFNNVLLNIVIAEKQKKAKSLQAKKVCILKKKGAVSFLLNLLCFVKSIMALLFLIKLLNTKTHYKGCSAVGTCRGLVNQLWLQALIKNPLMAMCP